MDNTVEQANQQLEESIQQARQQINPLTSSEIARKPDSLENTSQDQKLNERVYNLFSRQDSSNNNNEQTRSMHQTPRPSPDA